MTTQSPKPSCHTAMTSFSATQNRFGTTTNIINGGIECGRGAPTPGDQDRVGYFKRYLSIMGLPTPPDNLLYCSTLTAFSGRR